MHPQGMFRSLDPPCLRFKSATRKDLQSTNGSFRDGSFKAINGGNWPAGARGAGADCQRVLSALCSSLKPAVRGEILRVEDMAI